MMTAGRIPFWNKFSASISRPAYYYYYSIEFFKLADTNNNRYIRIRRAGRYHSSSFFQQKEESSSHRSLAKLFSCESRGLLLLSPSSANDQLDRAVMLRIFYGGLDLSSAFKCVEGHI
eukprot:scaffold6745_cov70-Cylindrotheca_fusiformis.AAC.6